MPRGAKPGERRGGRKKGQPNKATAEIKALAQSYGPEAIKVLVALMRKGEFAATKELLDRGYGKSVQPIAGDNENGPIRIVLSGVDARL